MKGKLAETLRELAETIKANKIRVGVPRACGGDPDRKHTALEICQCSPRMRG